MDANFYDRPKPTPDASLFDKVKYFVDDYASFLGTFEPGTIWRRVKESWPDEQCTVEEVQAVLDAYIPTVEPKYGRHIVYIPERR